MKKTLAFDANSKQFRCDVGKPPRRLYLGGDRDTAQRRKVALVDFWARISADGWTDEHKRIANLIAKGEAVECLIRFGESEAEYQERLADVQQKVAGATKVDRAFSSDEVSDAMHRMYRRKIAALEERLRETAGSGAVEGLTVTVGQAIEAYVQFQTRTRIDPDTGAPTEHTKTQGNALRFVGRLVAPDLRLSALTFSKLNEWCLEVAKRPLSRKTNRPIALATVGSSLKALRAFIKWAGGHYGWKRPDEWLEATKVRAKPSQEERRAALVKIGKHYTFEEIGTLWRFAIPSERMLLMLGLNFGGAQAEILSLIPEDVAGEETAALRSKTGVLGRWLVWPETRALAVTEFASVPRKRQGIANKWNQLLDRVCKDHPDFKRLSFKWLRKTGSSLIRKIADGEVASLYLSHGESPATDDDVLDVYASADWDKVVTALATFREQLLPHMTAPPPPQRTYTKLGTIDTIRQMWRDGEGPEQIMSATGKSRATVYRYRPEPALACTSPA